MTDEVSLFLRASGIRLNTDLGQHFLTDDEVLRDIVEAADLSPGDRVLEIGPGIGILTRELLKKGAIVTAIEIDKRMIPLLKEFTKEQAVRGPEGPSGPERGTKNQELTVIQGNALHIPPPSGPYKVVANIPYHITSPLLRHLLLETENRPTSLTLLIQREVAENMCAEHSESILSVLVQLFGTATFVRTVRKEAFLPPPEVESAVVHIECNKEPPNRGDAERILKLAKHAMSGRRKMLGNTIGKLPGGMEAMETSSIDPKRRPQTLTIEEWSRLSKNV